MSEMNLLETARRAVELARQKGAKDAAASVGRARAVDVTWRDGKLETITEATTRGLSLELYVDERYSAVSTRDLRPEALEAFIADAVALARTLEKDPFRALPDPGLYQGQASVDLQLADDAQAQVTPQDRKRIAEAIEAAARSAPARARILSVTTGSSDDLSESVRVHSNGFEGTRRTTSFSAYATVSVEDPDGRKPEDDDYAVTRFRGAMPDPQQVGRRAAERAFARIGARKGQSAVLPVAVDNRAAGRLFRHVLGPLGGSSLQQKRSFFEGKLGTQVGSPLLDVADDPLVPRGLGSRLFDGEGIAARRFPVFEGGVLRSYYIDNYYGRKLGMAPTTGGSSNLTWKLGTKSRDQLLADLKDGVLVTSFIGGNSNGLTGDFSVGIMGYRVRGGALAEPIAEMNVSGNHLDFWKRLVAVGNDPYPYSSLGMPTLVFDKVQVAGS